MVQRFTAEVEEADDINSSTCLLDISHSAIDEYFLCLYMINRTKSIYLRRRFLPNFGPIVVPPFSSAKKEERKLLNERKTSLLEIGGRRG